MSSAGTGSMAASASAAASASSPPDHQRYVSVRDSGDSPRLYSFEECLLSGYGADGGMFLPYALPHLLPAGQSRSSSLLASWSRQRLSYIQLGVEVLSLFIPESEVPKSTLHTLAERSFAKFLKKVNNHSEGDASGSSDGKKDAASKLLVDPIALEPVGSLHICETWHGPTLAFKDLALQMCGHLLNYFMQRRSSSTSTPSMLSLLVGTSGDTGSASIEAVRGLDSINIFVLYPGNNRISLIQELQMITVLDSNVYTIECDGSSDDLDVPIKQCFDDNSFRNSNELGTINSVNICRILMQCVHFIWCYLQLIPYESIIDESKTLPMINFSLPTGACGHLIAATMVKRMGIPIQHICAAVNSNNIIETFATTGLYHPPSTVNVTYAPAMDITSPYNIERLLYYISAASYDDTNMSTESRSSLHQKNARFVNSALNSLSKDGKFQLNEDILRVLNSKIGLVGKSASQSEILQTIKDFYEKHHYLIDPHTAVGVHAALTHSLLQSSSPSTSSISATSAPSVNINSASSIPTVVIATAHAAKFPETCLKALSQLDITGLNELFQKSPFVNVGKVLELHHQQTKRMKFGKADDWQKKLRELITSVHEEKVNRKIKSLKSQK